MTKFKTKTKTTPLIRWGQAKKRINWNIFIVFLVCLAGVSYLALTNSIAISGYELKSLEQKVEQLKEEIRGLETKAVSGQSMWEVEQRVVELGFVKTANIEYIKPSAPVVAIK